jgi:hypothetical protein
VPSTFRWARILVVLSGASLSRAAHEPSDLDQAEWQVLTESQGIQTLRWRPPGRDLLAFKGVGVIDAALEGKIRSEAEAQKFPTDF